MTSSFILIHKKYFYFIAFDISITNLSKQNNLNINLLVGVYAKLAS